MDTLAGTVAVAEGGTWVGWSSGVCGGFSDILRNIVTIHAPRTPEQCGGPDRHSGRNTRFALRADTAQSRTGARQRRQELLSLVRELKNLGFIPRMFRRRDRLDAWMADPQRRAKVRCLIAAGGDGTVNDLLTRFPSVPTGCAAAGHGEPARHVSADSLLGCAAARTVAFGNICRFDVGQVNDRRFIMCAGIGLDAAVIETVHRAEIRPYHQMELRLAHSAAVRRAPDQPTDISQRARGSSITGNRS